MNATTKTLIATAVAAGGLVTAQSADAAGLLIADGRFGGKLEIVSHDADVVVNNGIAVTEVEQVFRNTENRIVEALYVFPVPEGASVADFSMWIGGREMTGEVLEKRRAREIYESYKQTRVDPGLLEQVDYRTFEMRIFPIAAGAEQRVKLTYYQELDVDHDTATYVYPLATTVVDGEADTTVQGRFSFDFDVKTEVPISELTSPSHGDDFAVTRPTSGSARASLELAGGDLSEDIVVHLTAERPVTGIDLVANKPDGEDGYFQLTLTAGQELEQAMETGMDYVFVLDVSGSMASDRKLELSADAARSFVSGLGEDDRFEVLTFNNGLDALFGNLRDADDATMQEAQTYLDGTRAAGGTRLRPAFEAAYRYATDPDRPLNVVVLSDGLSEQSTRSELTGLIQSRPANTRVFCVGVGNDVNRPLLEDVAER
ncbi:MAG: VIT and VWA domain-containing protein, partial [Planctomycetota bacterium]